MNKDYDNVELRIFCEYFNKIIEQAIIHGGDCGGAYYTNQENLINSINTFLKWRGLDKYLIIYNDEIPKLIIKGFLKESK